MKRPYPSLGLLAGSVLGGLLGYAASGFMEADEAQINDNPPALTYADRLVKENDCWTGEAPKDMQGKLPGHVVLRYEDDLMAMYGGEEAVGDALDFEFKGADNGVAEVMGFCR